MRTCHGISLQRDGNDYVILSAGLDDGGDKAYAAGSAGYGGVEPAVEVHAGSFLGNVTKVYIDILPLTALSLVAGHRIGIFDLQSIEIGVGA